MTKQEFLETLGRILNRELSEQEVAENLHYYEQYISQQMNSGKTEAQVLAELGDPRLIARTILQVDQQREEEVYESRESIYTEEEDGTFWQEKQQRESYDGGYHVHTVSGIKSLVILVLVLIVLLMLISTVFKIALKLLPVALVIAVVLWIYREFVKK